MKEQEGINLFFHERMERIETNLELLRKVIENKFGKDINELIKENKNGTKAKRNEE